MNPVCIESNQSLRTRLFPRLSAWHQKRIDKLAAERLAELVATWISYGGKTEIPDKFKPLAEGLAEYTNEGPNLHYDIAESENNELLITAYGDKVMEGVYTKVSIFTPHDKGKELFTLTINLKDDLPTILKTIKAQTAAKVDGRETTEIIPQDHTAYYYQPWNNTFSCNNDNDGLYHAFLFG